MNAVKVVIIQSLLGAFFRCWILEDNALFHQTKAVRRDGGSVAIEGVTVALDVNTLRDAAAGAGSGRQRHLGTGESCPGTAKTR